MNEASCQTQRCTRQDPCPHWEKSMLFEEIHSRLLRYKLHNSREFIPMEHSTEALWMMPKLCYESQKVHAKHCKRWGTVGRSDGETSPQSWHLNLTERDDGFSCRKMGAEDSTSKIKTHPLLTTTLFLYSLPFQSNCPKGSEQMLSPISDFNPLPSPPCPYPTPTYRLRPQWLQFALSPANSLESLILLFLSHLTSLPLSPLGGTFLPVPVMSHFPSFPSNALIVLFGTSLTPYYLYSSKNFIF